MMGTGVTLTEICERKPQSERAALEARAAILWRLVKVMVGAARDLKRAKLTEDNQRLWKSKRAIARSYLELWAETRKQIRELGE